MKNTLKTPQFVANCINPLIKVRIKLFTLGCAFIIPMSLALSIKAEPAPVESSKQLAAQAYPSFADVVEPLMPAVVNIYTIKYKKFDNSRKKPFPETFPFDQFSDLFEQFNLPFGFEEMYSDPKAVSLGSGFIIDSSGYIVTNYHVVNNVDEISIKFHDNTELPAKLIGSDKRTDLALLKVEAKKPLPFVKFGDSSKARVGDWIIAIGNPFGLGGTVTTGIISSKGRDIGGTEGIVDDFIQTDAAINSGNSGGPAFNLAGEVIGINTAIYTPTGVNVGIGFAIPSNTAQNIIDQLKKMGKISRGRLDVTIQEVTPEIAEGLGLKEPIGALIVDVQQGGAGDKAGLKSGDIIVEFAGQQVKTSRKLQVLVAETPIDTDVKMVLIRNGKKHDLVAKITENEKAPLKSNKKPTSNAFIEKNNIKFSNLTDELRQRFAINEELNGVVVTNIDKNHKSHGLMVGDLVTAVNQQPITNIDQLNAQYDNAITTKKQNIVLLVKRRGTTVFIALPSK